MYVAVHHGGLRLAEVVPQVGMKYQAAPPALVNDPERKRFVAKLRHALSTINYLDATPAPNPGFL